MNRKLYDYEEIEYYKENLTDYETLKFMDRFQQSELFKYWEKEFSVQELSNLMNVDPSKLYSLRTNLRKSGHLPKTKRSKKSKPTSKPQPTSIAEYKANTKDSKKQDEYMILPDQYKQQIEEVNRIPQDAPEDPKVSLDEFMKMLEIQEKIAHAVEDQQEKKSDGFSLSFNGEFTADQLEKRLNKIIAMIEDEPYKYSVRLEVSELEEETEKEEEASSLPNQNELLNEVNDLRDNLKEIHKEIKEKDSNESEELRKWAKGYQSLQSDQEGVHTPKSEFSTHPYVDGTKEKNGIITYQTFYICSGCKNRGKHFIPYSQKFITCHDCGKRMRVRLSVEEGKFEQDSYGNFYIAGEFKRANEFETEGSS